MKARSGLSLTVTACAWCALLGCQSNQPRTPATLERADPETLARVEAVLAQAMGDASIELGPADLAATTTISVLPPRLTPYEDRSLARPTQFDIMLEGARCLLVRRDTGEEYDLDGVACRPAGE